VTRHRTFTVALIGAGLALAACGADQDPALELPSSTSTTAGDATGTPPGAVSDEVVFENIPLTGAAEVPGPGDEDGDGFANVFLQPEGGQICYDIVVNGIDAPTAAHIHEGAAGVAGPVVVPLETPVVEGGGAAIDSCASADAVLIDRIAADPTGFYINVHNADFPDGALRGQLAPS
jgi:hypothetical protein